MIALVNRLPQEIVDLLIMENQSGNTSYFTEKKLRPLTLLNTDEEKIEKFHLMIKAIPTCMPQRHLSNIHNPVPLVPNR
jgi:hypothetical protein